MLAIYQRNSRDGAPAGLGSARGEAEPLSENSKELLGVLCLAEGERGRPGSPVGERLEKKGTCKLGQGAKTCGGGLGRAPGTISPVLRPTPSPRAPLSPGTRSRPPMRAISSPEAHSRLSDHPGANHRGSYPPHHQTPSSPTRPTAVIPLRSAESVFGGRGEHTQWGQRSWGWLLVGWGFAKTT